MDGHFIMDILANLPKEYAMMSTQLYVSLSQNTVAVCDI